MADPSPTEPVEETEVPPSSSASGDAWPDEDPYLEEVATYLDNLDDPNLVSIDGVWYAAGDEAIEGLPVDPPPDDHYLAELRARVAHYRDPHAATDRLSKMTLWHPDTPPEVIAEVTISDIETEQHRHQAGRARRRRLSERKH